MEKMSGTNKGVEKPEGESSGTLKETPDQSVEKPKDSGGIFRKIGSRMVGLGKKVVGFAGIAAESVGEAGRDIARSFLTKQFEASEKNRQKWDKWYNNSQESMAAFQQQIANLIAQKEFTTEDSRTVGNSQQGLERNQNAAGIQALNSEEAREKSENLAQKLSNLNAKDIASYKKQAKYQKWLSGQ